MKIFSINFNHEKLYFVGLILTAICLPHSKFALSVSLIFLISNWILEFDFKRKLDAIKSNKSILIFVGIFLIHLIWLINTSNFEYAFRDLSNKAILILFPIIIGTSKKLSERQLKIIIHWFALAVVSSTLISASILFGVIDYSIKDIRDISPFMSHIRLSLLINIAIFSLSYYLISGRKSNRKVENVVYVAFILWLVVFLFLLKSFTGIVIFIITLFLSLGYVSYKVKFIVARLFVQVSLLTIFLLLASFLSRSISKFYTKENVDLEKLEEFTPSGNPYTHHKGVDQIENGNYLRIYLCEVELEREWNKRSELLYNGNDQKNQELKYTLMRYLTSKGFRKDSAGVSKLTINDIKNIEGGMANYIYENKYSIYPKIYELLWQIDVYKKGFNPAGNSITMRAEFVKTAFHIIQKNIWFGVGTGDVKDSFLSQYELDNSKMPKKYRLRAHNQFITFILSFGLSGFVLFLVSFFYPIFYLRGFRDFLFSAFIIIILLSFLNEDTLESQIGITLFSYFYSLLLFGRELNFNKN